MIVCNCGKTHIIGVDGGVRHIASQSLITELERQGWRIVINPKRTYYAEYDTTHPSYKEHEKIGISDSTETLEVEIV